MAKQKGSYGIGRGTPVLMGSFVHLREGDCNWHDGDAVGHE